MQAETKGEDVEQVPLVSLVEMFLKARELERQGHDVIHFDAGEPDFDPPQEVVEATISALRMGKARYTESAGVPSAKSAVANKLSEQYRLDISPEQVVITAGGRLALYYAFLSLPRQARIGIVTPDWPAYRELSNFMSMPITYFRTNLENGWDLDLDQVRDSECEAIVLNYPNNPTGKILDLAKFEELIRIANEKGMTVLSDEVYSDFLLNPSKSYKSILEFPDTKFILVTSLSKSYAMTGFRAGYIVSDAKTAAKITKTNSLIMTSMPEFVQYALIAAMRCEDYVKDKVQLIRKRRDVAARAFRKYLDAEFYLPDGSMYMLPKLHSSKGEFNSEKFALELLEKQHVSVTPGTSFGKWFIEHIRITLLQDEQRIEEGIERMSKLVG